MTRREAVLSALHAALSGIGATVLRNEPLPARIPGQGLVILRDGNPGEPEVTLSPLAYHWQHAAEIEAFVQGAARDATFDALCTAIGIVVAADRRLGGLCDWTECTAPESQDMPIDGAAPIRAAVITCTLHYSSDDALA